MKGKAFGALLLAAALVGGGTALGQEQTFEIKNGEVLAVDGSTLTVATAEGVRQFEVPPDFRFDLDGRLVPVSALEPGSRLTALVQTTTVPLELTRTEMRQGEVVYTVGSTLVVRNEQGELKKFTDKDLRSRGVVIYKDGEQVSPFELRPGDRLSATIVTKLPPVTITEKDVMVLAQAPSPPTPPATPPVAAAPRKPAPPAAEPVAMPKTAGPLPLVGFAGLALVVLGGALTVRRRS